MKGFSLNLDLLTESYVLCLNTEGKSPRTIAWYQCNLSRFANFLRNNNLSDLVDNIGKEEARRFISYLQNDAIRWGDRPYTREKKKLSPYTVQGYIRSIKAFWSWLMDEGYITNNPMSRLKLLKTPKKVVTTFSPEQIQKILNAIDLKGTYGFRNYTIILLLLDTGIRLSELTGLKMEDIDFLQSFIVVSGKGNKERVVPFGSQVRRTLRRYITRYRPEPDFYGTNEVFLTNDGLPMISGAVQSMLKRLGQKVNIPGMRTNPHRFRHTFAKTFLMNGGDIFSLQKILGHTSLEVVKIYVNLITTDILAQHRKYSPVDNAILSKKRNST